MVPCHVMTKSLLEKPETTLRSPVPVVAAARRADAAGLVAARADYDLVRQAVRFLTEHRVAQPGLEDLANAMGVAPTRCHKVFRRWCGLTPKDFVSALTLDHARSLLRSEVSVLDASLAAGLSGPSRLHDLFVSLEAMPPGAYRAGCAGLAFGYGVHPTPFGDAVAFVTLTGPRRLAGLAFIDEESRGTADTVLAEFRARWPKAQFVAYPETTEPFVDCVFGTRHNQQRVQPLRVVLIGTDFEVRVWERLIDVSAGQAMSYGGLAAALERPTAARAVGRAVGRNPLAFVVPCHRVMRADGGLGGYHWGLTRKQALIGWEAGKLAC